METYQREKKKTEKLLLDLLPRGVLEQMKRGKTPDAEYFDRFVEEKKPVFIKK